LPLAMSDATAALPPDEDVVAWEVGVAAADGVTVGAASVDAIWGAAVLAGAWDGATVGFAAFDDRLACCLADEATALLAVRAAAIMADAAESTPPTLMPTWLTLLWLTGSARSDESWAACGLPVPATRP
jgi:hypothetical protein